MISITVITWIVIFFIDNRNLEMLEDLNFNIVYYGVIVLCIVECKDIDTCGQVGT